MNKTISINISGIVFNIEESAFEKLKAYIESIKNYFKQQEGGDEIVADIEARIAEIFNERLTAENAVVTDVDVEFVISNLGQAQEMMDEDEMEEEEKPFSKKSTFSSNSENKKLFRDTEDKLVAGVASGMSYYLGIDAVWIRLIFLLITLVGTGSGIIIYAILWAIVPEARSTADKLKMKGKPINVSNIEQSIKDGFETISNDLNEFVNDPDRKDKIKRGTKRATTSIGKVVEAIIEAVTLILKVLVRVVAIGFIVVATIALVGLSIGFFGSLGIFGFVFSDVIDIAIPNGLQSGFLILTLFAVVAIPLIILLVRAFQVILKQGSITKPILLTSFIIWIVSVIGLFAQITSLGMQLRANAKVDKEVVLSSATSNRYYIESTMPTNNIRYQRHYNFSDWSEDEFYFENEKFYYKNVDFRVERSNDSDFHLIKRFSSKGSNYSNAVENANAVEYIIEQTDSSIILSPFLALENAPFRFQDVTVILRVPEGKEIMFLNYTTDITNHASYYANHYNNYPNKVFRMSANGLKYVAGITKSEVKEGMLSYSYEGFEYVEVNSEVDINAEVIEGDKYRVMLSENLVNNSSVNFTSNSNTLKIEIEKESLRIDDEPVHLLIEVPSLRKFSGNGVGNYLVRTERSSGIIDLDFTGAVTGIFDGHIDDLNVDVAGISNVDLKGSTKTLNCDIAGSSKLFALEMISEKVDLDLAGVCAAEVFATDILRIDVGGSSKVSYKGSPQISKNIAGVATIEKIED